MTGGTAGSEYDQGIPPQEIAQPETSEPARTSFLTYLAFGMLAMSGVLEVADGIAMHDQSRILFGGSEILTAALAYFVTPHRYRRA